MFNYFALLSHSLSLSFSHNYNSTHVLYITCSLQGTNISAPARHMLEELSQSRDDLTVTFVHHAALEKMKEKGKERKKR